MVGLCFLVCFFPQVPEGRSEGGAGVLAGLCGLWSLVQHLVQSRLLKVLVRGMTGWLDGRMDE